MLPTILMQRKLVYGFWDRDAMLDRDTKQAQDNKKNQGSIKHPGTGRVEPDEGRLLGCTGVLFGLSADGKLGHGQMNKHIMHNWETLRTPYVS